MAVAALIVSGIWLSEFFAWTPFLSIFMTCVLLSVAAVMVRCHKAAMEFICLGAALICLGGALWTVRSSTEDGRDIGQLAAEGHVLEDSAVRLTGFVANIPALDSVVDSNASKSSRPQQIRTLFLVKAKSLVLPEQELPIRGMCRVLVEGDATSLLRWGDRVELTGQIDRAEGPLNPGEFDYARHLHRNGVSVMMFLKHPAAARVLQSSWWHPQSLLSGFRQQTVAILKTHLSPGNRATAEALLLGNRGHLTRDLERDFISSGTMHLLAISGLHVGILYVFLVRIQNLLLVPRTRALVLGGIVCIFYCFLTDLRPSVMRATVFIVLHILGQVFCRDLRMGSLIGATTLLLVTFDPSIAFDVGAWLSFLAVGALGWVSNHAPPVTDRPVPLDALTWQDRIRDFRTSAAGWLGLSCRQMIAVTTLSAPLVATQFHMVSLTGMLINILLIPFTTGTLIAGYVFIAVGLVVPPLAFLPGFVFGTLLALLNYVVALSADVRLGFVTIPDLPAWFLPSYYLLLVASAVATQSLVRQWLRLSLLAVVSGLFWVVCQTPLKHNLECTVLSVGHGNAVIVEAPGGKVMLFDAGALNRGDRTADLISRFLWRKGYRMIDAIVISHPDMDHYNAVTSLLDRMPVGQVILTAEFVRSKAPEVLHVLDTISSLGLRCDIGMHGDRIVIGEMSVDFLQADLKLNSNKGDNASSLVALVRYAGRCVCLPGDLEGEGQSQLMSALPVCDLLVSPHHGSTSANSKALANQIRPRYVAVSAKDERLKNALTTTFSRSEILMTSLEGAITYRVGANGVAVVDLFKSKPRGVSVSEMRSSF